MSENIGNLIEKSLKSLKNSRGKPSRRKTKMHRMLRSRVHLPEHGAQNFTKTSNVFVGAHDVDDYIQSNLVVTSLQNGRSIINKTVSLYCTEDKWKSYVIDQYHNDDFLILQKTEHYTLVYNKKTYDHFEGYSSENSSIRMRVWGSIEFVENLIEEFTTEFDQMDCYIDWIYSPDGSSARVPLNTERMPLDEMYPFLKGEPLQDYINRYVESPSSILLLIGPPGTGKTSFIRGLLGHTRSSAVVTYDSGILEKDHIFAQFIEDSNQFMILEDSDNFLKSREDGNTMMHRFLNVGDGLVTSKGKKLVFSTNLPSIRDIDPALIRPGRCFDILEFDYLNQKDAQILADKVGANVNIQSKSKWTISEIFNEVEQTPAEKTKSTRKVGFV